MPTNSVKGKISKGYGELTQRVVNRLPEWHEGRRNRNSLYHKMVNAVFGVLAEDIEDLEIPNYEFNRHVSTIDTTMPDKAYLIKAPNLEGRSNRANNMLRNSNFINWSNPVLFADYWEAESTIQNEAMTLIQATSLENYIGGMAVLMQTALPDFFDFGTVTMKQEILTVDSQAETETGFILGMFAKKVDIPIITNNYFQMFVTATHKDNTTETFTSFVNPTSEWLKYTLPVTLSEPAVKIEVGVSFTCLDVDPSRMLVDNFFLFKKTDNRFWSNHPLDKPANVSKEQNGLFVMTSKQGAISRHVFFEISTGELKRRVIPTRATVVFP